MKMIAGLLAFGIAALATPLAAQAPAAPATGPLAAEELFAPRRLSAEISPSGRSLALVQRVGDKDRLVVIDLEARVRTEVHNPANLDFTTIHDLYWKGDDRLIIRQS